MTYEEFLTRFREKLLSYRQNGNRLYFEVRKEDIREIGRFLFEELGCRLSTSTATEVYDGFEVQHHFSDDREGRYFSPLVRLSREEPEMDSLVPVTKAAAWIEREIHDLFGIVFHGHPALKPLLKEDNEGISGHPLRQEGKEQE